MLRYLGTGRRWYARQSIRVMRRGRWEFQAVVDGQIAPVLTGQLPLAHSRSLWLFPPQQAHGWTGEEHESAEVVVFHFIDIPEPLNSFACEAGYLRCDLDDAAIADLRRWSETAADQIRDPGPLSSLLGQRLLLDLALMVLERCALPINPRPGPRAIVDRAIAWFRQHLRDGVGVDDVARAVEVSPSHLRRLFHEVFNNCPKTMFEQLRMQLAADLLADLETPIEMIAERVGYGSASAFSRAFSQWTGGTSPRAWRGSRKPYHRAK